MAKFQNPGAFFLGTLVAQEQKFLKPLIENARKQGYTRFVEPCAGAFAHRGAVWVQAQRD